MPDILRLIASYCTFLFYDYSFRLIDSEYLSGMGGYAHVILSDNRLNLRIIKDRDGLFLHFYTRNMKPNEWFDFEEVGQLLTGNEKFNGDLNKINFEILRINFPKLIQLFSDDQIQVTIANLQLLQTKRAEKLFGKLEK